MPFKWEMEPSVKLIKSALARDEPVLNFPGLFSAAVWALGASPLQRNLVPWFAVACGST